MEGLGVASSGFTKPHTADNTHHLGNRRKYTSKSWIRIVLWCAYLTADWVATVALGVISNNLGDVMEGIGKDRSRSESIQLTAFWAPFLLLHLGGPDTITAYAMEDNELWLRHLLALGVQTGVALHFFLIAWTGSQLSILYILIFCAGIIKYGKGHGFSGRQAMGNLENLCSFLLNLILIIPSSCGNIH